MIKQINDIAMIGDGHVGARTGSEFMRQFIKGYILDYFLPYCKDNGIHHVIQAGDFFDVRKFLYGRDRDWLVNEFVPKTIECEVEWHMDVGNHDITLGDDTTMNWPEWLAAESNGYVVAYAQPTEVIIGEAQTKFLFLPWITANNYDDTLKAIEETDAPYCIAHLELAGFPMYQGSISEHGHICASKFKKFTWVFTGHYHTISCEGNIQYLGAPYHLNWQDHKDGTNRGFWVFGEGNVPTLIKNSESQSVFRVIEYNQESMKPADHKNWADKDWLNDELGIRGQIVRIVVENRDNNAQYKKFNDALKRANTIDYMVVDKTVTTTTAAVEVKEEVIQQDVLEILQEKVKGTEGIRHEEVASKLDYLYANASNGGLISDNN